MMFMYDVFLFRICSSDWREYIIHRLNLSSVLVTINAAKRCQIQKFSGLALLGFGTTKMLLLYYGSAS